MRYLYYAVFLVSCFYAWQSLAQPEEGFVPNAGIAIRIAEAIIIGREGTGELELRKPLSAVLVEDVWHVTSSPISQSSTSFGGRIEVEISKKDGKILRYHVQE